MTELKIAFRLAFARDLRQRWRQICIVTGAAVAVCAALIGLGIVHAGWVSQQRVAERTPQSVLMDLPSGVPGINLSQRGLILGRKQFSVVWIQPNTGDEKNSRLVPPGLSRLPEPGEAVLSPGIKRLGFRAEDLGFQSSSAGLGAGGAIGDAGLETGTEYLMYVRPAAGQDLGKGGSLQTATGFAPQPLTWKDMILTQGEGGAVIDGQLPPFRDSFLYGLVLIFCPCLYLALGAARAMSPVRSQRSEFLWRLGISRRTIRTILLAETGALAAAGAASSLAIWLFVLSDRIRQLPFSDTVFIAGDFSIPWYVTVAAALVIVSAMMLCAIAGPIGVIAPVRIDKKFSSARVFPLIFFGLTMFTLEILPIDRSTKRPILMVAMLGMLVALPISLPLLVALVAPKLASAGDRVVWLAGRRLAFKSKNLSRPAVVVAALILVTGISLGLYQKISQGDGEGVNSRVTVFSTTWRGERPGDFQKLSQRLADYQVVALVDEALVFTDCKSAVEFARIFRVSGCTRNEISRELIELSRSLFGGAKVTLAPRLPKALDSVLIAHPGVIDEPKLMYDIGGTLPAVNNTNILTRNSVEHRAGWVAFYWWLASTLLMLGVIREVGDRALLALSGAKVLRRLSLTEKEIRRLNRWTLFFPIAIAVPVGYFTAVLFSHVGGSIELTAGGLGLLSTATAIAVACGLCGLVFAGITALSHRIEAQDLV